MALGDYEIGGFIAMDELTVQQVAQRFRTSSATDLKQRLRPRYKGFAAGPVVFLARLGLIILLARNVHGDDSFDSARVNVDDGSSAVRIRAIETIAAEGGPGGIPILLRLAKNDRNVAVRIRAIEELGGLKDKKSLLGLEQLAQHRNAKVAQAAAEAVQKIGPVSDEERQWLEVRTQFIVVERRVIAIPEFDFSYLNSNKSPQIRREIKEQTRGLSGEAFVERSHRIMHRIPDWTPGQFGLIWKNAGLSPNASCQLQVEKILGPKDVVVARKQDSAGVGLRLWNVTIFLHCVGFDAGHYVVHDDWLGGDPKRAWPFHGMTGDEVAVVGWDVYVRDSEVFRAALVVPLDIARDGLTWEQFQDLKRRGVKLEKPEGGKGDVTRIQRK